MGLLSCQLEQAERQSGKMTLNVLTSNMKLY